MSVRVKVNLNNIFNDYRKEAFVYVDQNYTHVSDFEKHIRQLFNIQFDIYLTIGGSLLPPNEIVKVIHSGDSIIVNRFDRKKIASGFEVVPIENGNDLQPIEQHTIETDNQSNEESNPSKRGKRIRKRKRKPVAGNDVADTSNTDTVATLCSIVQPNKLLKESRKLFTELSLTNAATCRKAPSHIRFDNDTTGTNDTTRLSAQPNHLDDLQARVIRPVTVLTDAGIPSNINPVPSKSNCDVLTPNDVKRDDINSLKDFANDSNFAERAASIDFEKIVKNIDKRSDFVALKEEPKTYDVLAFKMLKIGKNYEPQLSEWIIAMVRDVEDVNVTMRVLAGKEETSSPEGKLSMDIGDGEEDESSDIITLQRSDMLNVKVYHNE